MKKCPFCAEEIQDEAIVCKHCGRDLKAGASQVQIVQPKKKTGCMALGCAGVLVFLFLGWIMSFLAGRSNPPAVPASTAMLKPPSLTKEQVESNRKNAVASGLLEAKRVVSDTKECGTPKSIGDAWGKLRLAKQGDPEWAEALRVVPALEACRKKTERTLAQGLQEIMRQQRLAFAGSAERTMLDQGMEVDFTVAGTNKDRLRVKWALMGKAAVHKITNGGSMNDGAFLANVQKIGFRRVEFADGYDFAVYYDLQPTDEAKGGSTVLSGMGLGSVLKLPPP